MHMPCPLCICLLSLAYQLSYLLIYSIVVNGQTREQFSSHSLTACKRAVARHLFAVADNLHKKLRPKDDTCCFSCFLPTRVCKGPLLTNSSECFSPDLLKIFWSTCFLAYKEQDGELDHPYLDPDWLPKAWDPSDFCKPEWRFDTEVIQGAWVFYCFARGYWRKHGF